MQSAQASAESPATSQYGPSRRVQTLTAMLTPDIVDELLAAQGVPDEPDRFSIDVDGSDYWIWRGLERHRPRVVVQLREPMLASGLVTSAEIDRVLALCDDPAFASVSPITMAARGRRLADHRER